MMKSMIYIALLSAFVSNNTIASNVFPSGSTDNSMYYKIGGSSDYSIPPVTDQTPVDISASANLGLGNSCSAINPAVSVVNTMNDIKNSTQNLESSVITSATAAVTSLPMYELSKHNPALYSLINGKLLEANETVKASIKSCEAAREEIDKGVNPYHEWGSIAVNDQWNKSLSLAGYGAADINQVKKSIDGNRGDDGVPWVTGHAGGKNMPPVHVIADTAIAGYNMMIGRAGNLNDKTTPNGSPSNNVLIGSFKSPIEASEWISSVVGDQYIATCNLDECTKNQKSILGHGLMPMLTSCKSNPDDCTPNIQTKLGELVSGNATISKENLESVSTDGVVISPDAIIAIQRMSRAQQSIIVSKLSQEVAMQRLVDKAFIAKDILSAGAQVPVIESNAPAQKIIQKAITDIDNDIKSIVFESQMRKQLMSDTLMQVMEYSHSQVTNAMNISTATPNQPIMNGGSISNSEKRS